MLVNAGTSCKVFLYTSVAAGTVRAGRDAEVECW